MAAELPVHIYVWLYYDPYGIVGVYFEVCCDLIGLYKRRLLTYAFSVSYIGLTNGGTAGMIWMSLICWIGFLFINTSM